MIADLFERLRALVLRGRWGRELDEEMRFHIEQEEAARVRAGADPETARRQARLSFGGLDPFKEATRDATGVRPLQDLAADAAFALRALRRQPGFTATAVGVLGLAIGAATAVFAVVDAVLLSELPYPHANRLVLVCLQNSPTNRWSLSTVDFETIRDQQRSFSAFGVVRPGVVALTGAGEPESLRVGLATSGFFRALGLVPGAGRLPEPADDRWGAPSTVVVSESFARTRWGASPAAIDRTLTLDGRVHTVIGVLPAGVEELGGIPAVAWPVLQLEPPKRRGPFGMRGIGLLKDGVSLESAASDVRGISERMFPLWATGFKDETARYVPYPLRDIIVGDAPRQIRLFAGAVVLVLLVAIANVATLVLVRTAAREHELAVRAALGASRIRLARLVLTECLVLTTASAAAGLYVASVALRLVESIAPHLPRAREIALGTETGLVALGLGLVSGLLVGVSPIVRVLAGKLAPSRAEVRRSGGDRRSHAARAALVAFEFALAVPLLVAAALLTHSALRLQGVDPGYDAGHTLFVRLSAPPRRYAEPAAVAAFWKRAVDRALETPGAIAAGLGTAVPPDTQGDVNNFNLVAHPVPPGGAEPMSPWASVTPGYFEALGIRLLEGRMLAETDSGDAPPVVVVSRSWARHYFPGEEALGQQLIEGGCYACPRTTIVGIVGDVKYEGLAGSGDGVYRPLAQSNDREAMLFVRAAAAPASLVRPVLERLRGVDPEMPLSAVTMATVLRRSLADPRRFAAVLGVFAGAALLLAALGIFGLMSYVVRRQRREIGVRLALGAAPRRIARMIVGRGMRHVAAGTLVGLALALAQGRFLAALLFGVTPHDPGTLALVLGALFLAALLACALPGFAASRIRPAEAIAEE